MNELNNGTGIKTADTRVRELLAPSAETATPAGETLAVWLAKVIPGAIQEFGKMYADLTKTAPRKSLNGLLTPASQEKQDQAASIAKILTCITHYSGLVLVGKAMTPAAYYTAYPAEALELWGIYNDAMQSVAPPEASADEPAPQETPTAESVKKPTRTAYRPPPPLTKGGRLSEAGELVARFMEEYRITTQAGKAYLGVVQYAKALKPQEFFKQYPAHARELWEYYAHTTVKNIQAEMENIRAELDEMKA
jgi:hypothetical protein